MITMQELREAFPLLSLTVLTANNEEAYEPIISGMKVMLNDDISRKDRALGGLLYYTGAHFVDNKKEDRLKTLLITVGLSFYANLLFTTEELEEMEKELLDEVPSDVTPMAYTKGRQLAKDFRLICEKVRLVVKEQGRGEHTH